MALETYKKKRDLKQSKEPSGKKKKAQDIFVIQEHDATHLHWDFRLAVNGVMPSWAVTKEPSMTEKRLAVKTEDHPIEYAKFHGIIPKGNYGAGTVKIWDSGKYENLKEQYGISMKKSIEEGKVEFELFGKKLKGKWALIRMKPNSRYRGDNWLFFKMKK